MKKKLAQAKAWTKEHSFEILAVTGVIAAAAVLTPLAIKAEEAQREHEQKIRDWMIGENQKGRTVFNLADGSYLSVDTTK